MSHSRDVLLKSVLPIGLYLSCGNDEKLLLEVQNLFVDFWTLFKSLSANPLDELNITVHIVTDGGLHCNHKNHFQGEKDRRLYSPSIIHSQTAKAMQSKR